MMEKLTRAKLEADSRSLIEVRASSLGFEITTPVIYPDGDCILVIVAADRDGYTIHDAGVASMRLTSEGFRPAGVDFVRRFQPIVSRYECNLDGGRVVRSSAPDDVPRSVMLVANASRSIADAAAEARRQTESQFRDALAQRVREIAGPRLRENEMFHGKSGTGYRVPSVILDDKQSQPIAFVVGLPSRGAVAGRFRELFDLRSAFPRISNESIYNEMSDFRPEEDGWVLRQVGELAPFSMVDLRIPALMEARLQ